MKIISETAAVTALNCRAGLTHRETSHFLKRHAVFSTLCSDANKIFKKLAHSDSIIGIGINREAV